MRRSRALITPGKVLTVDEGCNWIGSDLQIILRNGCVAIPGYIPMCPMGYTGPNGGPCTAHGVSMYKNTTGSAACTDCPVNAYSASSSTLLTSCQCNVGYYGANGSSCTEKILFRNGDLTLAFAVWCRCLWAGSGCGGVGGQGVDGMCRLCCGAVGGGAFAGSRSSVFQHSPSVLVRWVDARGCCGGRVAAWESSGRGQLQQACGFPAV